MSLTLEVRVPESVVLSAECRSLQATDASGRFGLRPKHENFVTVLEPCIISYRDDRSVTRYVAVDGGVLLLENGTVSITTREAVAGDQLEELADRAANLLETRQQRERQAHAEFAELQASLMHELGQVDRRKRS